MLEGERERIIGSGKKVTFRYLVTRIADVREVIVKEEVVLYIYSLELNWNWQGFFSLKISS